MHDPRKYPDPQMFVPERFLEGSVARDSGGKGASGTPIKEDDPSEIIFGFGRRWYYSNIRDI